LPFGNIELLALDSGAPGLFKNPDDDLMNVWYETGLSGKTTTFVHKYRKPN
jgi:hypothetical protein